MRGGAPFDKDLWESSDTGRVSAVVARFKYKKPLENLELWGMKVNFADGQGSSLSQIG